MSRALQSVLGAFMLFALPFISRADSPIAFIDVHVIPMDRERVLDHQTVIVQDAQIVELGPTTSVSIPRNAQQIQGHGTAYVLPGLADMHTHVIWGEDLALYTANGVTTLLQMGGAQPAFVRHVRTDVPMGQLVGPQVFFSFLVEDPNHLNWAAMGVNTPEQARAAVILAKVNGYDFIKVYSNLSRQAFTTIVDEARKQGIAVIGHGVRSVGLPNALFEGQVMVAHAEEFFYTAFDNKPNEALIPQVVDETYRSGAYVTPTLSTFETISAQWGQRKRVEEMLKDPRIRLLTPGHQYDWSQSPYGRNQGTIEPLLGFLRKLTKAFADKGVPLLTGTDSPVVPGMLPGYSIHEDLRTLQEAGLTTYQALSAATRIPGEFIARYVPQAQKFGEVKVGMRADLLVVNDNPLKSLEALKHPIGVMSGGRWSTENELQALLQAHKAAYEGQ